MDLSNDELDAIAAEPVGSSGHSNAVGHTRPSARGPIRSIALALGLLLSALPRTGWVQESPESAEQAPPQLGPCRQTHDCPDGATCRCAYDGNDLVLEERAIDGAPYLRIQTRLDAETLSASEFWDRGADGTWDRRVEADFGADGDATMTWDWGPGSQADWVCRTESCSSVMESCPLSCVRLAASPAMLNWDNVCQQYTAMCPAERPGVESCQHECDPERSAELLRACRFRYCAVEVGLCPRDEGSDDLVSACAREHGWSLE